MISAGLLETIRIIWAGLFIGKFLFYASGLVYYDEFSLPRFASVLLDGMVVSSLTALTYVYLLAGGDSTVRWLVYAICSSFLLRSAYTYLTCPPKCKRHTHACNESCQTLHCCCDAYKVEYNNAYYAMFASNVVTVASGFVIALLPANSWQQWLVFGLSFIPFIFVPIFLHKAISYTLARVSARSDVRWFMYFAGTVWLTYPIFYALSPVMTGIVAATTAEFAYAMADAVTKLLFGLAVSWSLRKQCGECSMCESGYAKKYDSGATSGYGMRQNSGVYAPVAQQQQAQPQNQPRLFNTPTTGTQTVIPLNMMTS